MTLYRVEFQLPYGVLRDFYHGPSLYAAVKRKIAFLRRGGGKAFIPCFINGKEIPPEKFRLAALIKEKPCLVSSPSTSNANAVGKRFPTKS